MCYLINDNYSHLSRESSILRGQVCIDYSRDSMKILTLSIASFACAYCILEISLIFWSVLSPDAQHGSYVFWFRVLALIRKHWVRSADAQQEPGRLSDPNSNSRCVFRELHNTCLNLVKLSSTIAMSIAPFVDGITALTMVLYLIRSSPTIRRYVFISKEPNCLWLSKYTMYCRTRNVVTWLIILTVNTGLVLV